MFDTLHLEIPNGSPLTKSFAKGMGYFTDETRKKFERRGRDYHYVRDLRFFDVPALWHSVNARSPEAGDKIEFIGAGDLTVGQMAGYIHECFEVDVDTLPIMRVDCTADLDGAWVPWCRQHVRVAGKQCVQHETPDKGGGGAVREYSRAEAETIYWGRGSRQTMVYDKTGQRRYLLQQKRKKISSTGEWNGEKYDRAQRAPLDEAFFDEYGYSMFQAVTRFERRMGAREVKTAFGFETFGKIQTAAFRNPFARMQFPETIHAKPQKETTLSGDERVAIMYFQDLIVRDGWTNARNEMRRVYGVSGRNNFYRKLQRFERFLLPTGTGPTREDVLRSYLASTLVQLAA